MISALLFDLDGTLLDSDMEIFMPHYMRALAAKLAHVIAPDTLSNALIASTRLMMSRSDHTQTNKDAFWADFLARVNRTYDELGPLLDEFYLQDFPGLQRHTAMKPAARAVIQAAFDLSFTVVIATQPVFPLAAIKHRLQWAGVGDLPYALITSYENMHSTKPAPAYYGEICALIGHAPKQCMMIGNDPDADIRPAARAGLHTFWLSDQGQAAIPGLPADYSGSLPDLLSLIKSGSLQHPI
jgi:FMN phosphatase YigB (HAD superfamily)